MREVVGLFVVALLAILALFQLRPVGSDPAFDPLLPGGVLHPEALGTSAKEAFSTDQNPVCLIVWVMDPGCPVSQQLAERQGARVRGVPGFYWLFAGPKGEVSAFVEEFDLDARQVTSLTATQDPRQALRRIGVGVTPTRLVVRSSDLTVEEVRVLNPHLLESPTAIEEGVCRSG